MALEVIFGYFSPDDTRDEPVEAWKLITPIAHSYQSVVQDPWEPHILPSSP